MRADGTGRSNGLPVLQLVLGAAMFLLALAVLVLRGELYGLVFLFGGAVQIVTGVQTYRRNQRLDREEDEGAGAAPASLRARSDGSHQG